MRRASWLQRWSFCIGARCRRASTSASCVPCATGGSRAAASRWRPQDAASVAATSQATRRSTTYFALSSMPPLGAALAWGGVHLHMEASACSSPLGLGGSRGFRVALHIDATLGGIVGALLLQQERPPQGVRSAAGVGGSCAAGGSRSFLAHTTRPDAVVALSGHVVVPVEVGGEAALRPPQCG